MEQKKRREIELHRWLTKEYQKRYSPEYARLYHAYWNSEILALSPRNPTFAVLDAGCGEGTFLKYLSKHYKQVYGIDLSLEMLQMGKGQDMDSMPFMVGDLEHTPFRRHSFDLVVCRGPLR